MSGGSGWKGLYGDSLQVEYSTEIPPVAGATWNAVTECRSGTNNAEEAQTDDFTSWDSAAVDERTGGNHLRIDSRAWRQLAKKVPAMAIRPIHHRRGAKSMWRIRHE